VTRPGLPAGSIGGFAFQDPDRDGVFENGEPALASQRLYLFDGTGAYRATTTSDATGWYQFDGLSDAAYRVEYAPDSWWAIRLDLVPDTTPSIFPKQPVDLAGSATADFGWRPIVRSTDTAAPISTYTAPDGLRVESYDDVVSARDLADDLLGGSLVGPEAGSVTIRFDLSANSVTATSTTTLNGLVVGYHATSNVSYQSWLDDGDDTLFHEYGHAWSQYYADVVQQDPTFDSYLVARGLAGDPRVGTSYAWDVHELIAEDYRELFGSPNAAAAPQMNTDLPSAATVPGLRAFLAGAFEQAP